MKAKSLSWRNFLVASGMRVFPAHVIKSFDGAGYLREYNFKLIPGTGPYLVTDSDIRKGTSISIKRRQDYWAAKYRANVGQYNFDELRYTVVRDQNLAFEQFKRGDIDHYTVNISQQWVQELNYDDFQRGVLSSARFSITIREQAISVIQYATSALERHTNSQGLSLSAEPRSPDQDVVLQRIRTAELDFPGTVYESPTNPKNEYNPQEALRLLAEAGWKDRDSQGQLVKDGKPLQIELLYSDKGSERWLTVYQQDLRKVGIGLNLRLVNPETRFKMLMQRQFDLISTAWGAGSVFPLPRPEFHSEGADVHNTNNVTGFKNKRVDQICEEYDLEFDPAKRAALLRELDGILASEYHNIMEWTNPSHRFAYWNRFGVPAGTFSRVGDEDGSLGQGIPQLWWVDPQKSQRLDPARRDKSIKMEAPAIEDRYWQEFAKRDAIPAAPQ